MLVQEEITYLIGRERHILAKRYFRQDVRRAKKEKNPLYERRLRRLEELASILGTYCPRSKKVIPNQTLEVPQSTKELADKVKRYGGTPNTVRQDLKVLRLQTGLYYSLSDYHMDARLFK